MNNYNYFNNNVDMYRNTCSYNIDFTLMQSLGFTYNEVQVLNQIMQYEGTVSTNKLVNTYGLDYNSAKRLKYMYDICTGKVSMQSEQDLIKHLRKMFGNQGRIGIHNLEVSRIQEIPRKALVAGIPEDSPFKIWNSKQYDPLNRMYDVVDVGSANITIVTTKIPILRYKEPKLIEGMLEIRGVPQNGKLLVSINKKYCKLCNRFVIAASLRQPEFHHGLFKIICVEGTKVYVFADTISSKKYSRYGSTSQRVYDYGFHPFEIQAKLNSVANEVYKRLCGVYSSYIAANSDYNVLTLEKDKEDDDNIIDID